MNEQARKLGRPPIGEVAMTGRERQAAYRRRCEWKELDEAEWELIAQIIGQFKNLCLRERQFSEMSADASALLEKLYRSGRVARPKRINLRSFI